MAKPKLQREPRHRFILNPYPDVRCSRCPRCEALMKLRKVPLLIHVDPRSLINMRLSVKLCPACDILIVHQDELEAQLAITVQERQLPILGNPYRVLGTLEVADWRRGMEVPMAPLEALAHCHPFREELELRVTPGGWFPAGHVPQPRPNPNTRGSHPAANAPQVDRGASTVYQLKITLAGVKPPVWRRVVVPADLRLHQLHSIFQIAMGWTDSHLHAFEIGGVEYGKPDREFDDLEMEDERRARLSSLMPMTKARFRYQYDFGDDWRHNVLVEQIRPAHPDEHYPLCLTGARACPPEDCGGPWGYAELLEALADPKHPEHKERKAWTRPGFDPAVFDLGQVNRALQRLRL